MKTFKLNNIRHADDRGVILLELALLLPLLLMIAMGGLQFSHNMGVHQQLSTITREVANIAARQCLVTSTGAVNTTNNADPDITLAAATMNVDSTIIQDDIENEGGDLIVDQIDTDCMQDIFGQIDNIMPGTKVLVTLYSAELAPGTSVADPNEDDSNKFIGDNPPPPPPQLTVSAEAPLAFMSSTSDDVKPASRFSVATRTDTVQPITDVASVLRNTGMDRKRYLVVAEVFLPNESFPLIPGLSGDFYEVVMF